MRSNRQGGLRAVYNSVDFDKQTPKYIRKPFVHKWSLRTDEDVYSAAKKALFTMCPHPENERDQSIFTKMLDNILFDSQLELKERLLREWKKQ